MIEFYRVLPQVTRLFLGLPIIYPGGEAELAFGLRRVLALKFHEQHADLADVLYQLYRTSVIRDTDEEQQ